MAPSPADSASALARGLKAPVPGRTAAAALPALAAEADVLQAQEQQQQPAATISASAATLLAPAPPQAPSLTADPSNLFVRFRGEWYDLTNWASAHPAGASFLLHFNRRDATEASRVPVVVGCGVVSCAPCWGASEPLSLPRFLLNVHHDTCMYTTLSLLQYHAQTLLMAGHAPTRRTQVFTAFHSERAAAMLARMRPVRDAALVAELDAGETPTSRLALEFRALRARLEADGWFEREPLMEVRALSFYILCVPGCLVRVWWSRWGV